MNFSLFSYFYFFFFLILTLFLTFIYVTYRALLGGSREDFQFSFVSRNALTTIFKEILRKLLAFVRKSPVTWVRNAGSLITDGDRNLQLDDESSTNVIEMAQFALDVLDGTFFCLKLLDDESDIVSSISSAVFIIDWEGTMATAMLRTVDDETKKKMKARLEFCAPVHTFRTNQFWGSLKSDCQKRLGIILTNSVRLAIFSEDNIKLDEIVSLCCTWMIEVLESFGRDQYQEQNLLDQLLCKGDVWSLWVTSDSRISKEAVALSDENPSADIYVSHFFPFLIYFFMFPLVYIYFVCFYLYDKSI